NPRLYMYNERHGLLLLFYRYQYLTLHNRPFPLGLFLCYLLSTPRYRRHLLHPSLSVDHAIHLFHLLAFYRYNSLRLVVRSWCFLQFPLGQTILTDQTFFLAHIFWYFPLTWEDLPVVCFSYNHKNEPRPPYYLLD